MANYKYTLNGYDYAPNNTGELNISIVKDIDGGSYQFTKELDGDLQYSGDAFDYIEQHGLCQKISCTITNICGNQSRVLYNGFFTKMDCSFDYKRNIVTVTPKEDSLYRCLTGGLDAEFNMLEVPTIVTAEYGGVPNLDFFFPQSNSAYEPFYGAPMSCGGFPPLSGLIDTFVRERVSTYCQGGVPQQPVGTGWELYRTNCSNGFSEWVRRADAMDCVETYEITVSTTPPPVTASNELWYLVYVIELSGIAAYIWVDYNEVVAAYGGYITLNNGRNLVDVINYGLNKVCPSLELNSDFLTNVTNSVTGNTPSSSEGIQIHAITDIRSPNASLPATLEQTTLRQLLEGWCANSLNCYWQVNEDTKKLVVEHNSTKTDSPYTTDLTAIDGGKWVNMENIVTYDDSFVPQQEVFESTETDIDFGGVPIVYANSCSNGVINYNRNGIFTDVQTIIDNPDEFGNDGLVFVLPNSMNLNDTRVEQGAITGVYKPNAPLAMANLTNKFWRQDRPFVGGNLNLEDVELEQRPVKLGSTVTIPYCCTAKFYPYDNFITNQDSNAHLETATISLNSNTIELQTRF